MQKPSVRPARSPRERPTGAPQSEREQNRLRSGTSGLSRTIARGSGFGTWGTETSPAPSRPRPDDPAAEPELRTDTERLLVRPESERESRPDTERRDFDDCDDVRALRLLERELPLPDESLPPPVIPVGGEPTMPPPEGGPPADTTGARPQVSQYSSPPPTSSYDPSQPGR
ncbi:hypothetical protein GCM10010121_055240 [Streptomyces brasiliensis]|uniref:Uncharacterized protein n=1 Tax=Streptomyces brasiliensis TaxID=1954 RepID=A0A917NX62_9ACTN|nr:hypothetical protein GCM10010121_055240 [Streptomyces brasiliensis]